MTRFIIVSRSMYLFICSKTLLQFPYQQKINIGDGLRIHHVNNSILHRRHQDGFDEWPMLPWLAVHSLKHVCLSHALWCSQCCVVPASISTNFCTATQLCVCGVCHRPSLAIDRSLHKSTLVKIPICISTNNSMYIQHGKLSTNIIFG